MKRLKIISSQHKKARKRLPQRSYIYLSFTLAGTTMIIPGIEWIIFVALIPLCFYVMRLDTFGYKKALIDFYLGGFILSAFAYVFLFQMAPQNWTVILTGWFAIAARAIAWFLVCSFCSLAFLVLGWALIKIKQPMHRLLFLPFGWAIAELLRSYLYALMSFGPGASMSPNFNWGALAVPASATPVIFTSRLVGFFGLSLLVVAVNVSLYFLLTKKSWRYGAAGLSAILLLGVVTWSQGNKTNNQTIQVALVHLNERDDLVKREIAIPKQGTDLLVLPEYSNIAKGKQFGAIASRLDDRGIGVTTDDVGLSPDSVNQIQYFNKQAEVVNKQNKTFLIPTGEFLPYSLQFSFWVLGQQKITEDFKYTQQLIKGEKPEYPIRSGDFSVGALACSGVSAFSQYRQVSHKGADILVNTASLSFLQEKSLYHVYARNMSRYHAVSNNKPFVQASRSGQSYIYDNQGNIVIEQQGNESQLLEATVSLR